MKTRTQNSFINASFGLGSQAVELILKVIGRTVFIKYLAVEYLGVNGLFGEILTVLSLAELGIGSAIGYALYKPLRENNTKHIAALMELYRKAYTIIGIGVGAVGALLIPFLRFIVKDPGPVKNELIPIYCFYLFNTVITYFYSYKGTILNSDQKSYITVTVKEICNVARTVFQVLVLVLWHNFYLYLAVESFFIFANNFAVSKITDKKYKYLKTQKNEEKLDKKATKEIFVNIKALSITKVSNILVNSSDNTIMSAVCGIAQTGLYSNYVMFTTMINTVLSQFFSAFMPSIGNLNAEGDIKHSHDVFNGLNMFGFWLYSFASIGVFTLVNDAITVWIGEKYLLSNSVVIIIALNLYIFGMQKNVWVFKDSYGLFKYGQYMSIVTAALNIGLSIWLGKLWGIFGVLVATAVSRLATGVWYDPSMLFKHGFKLPVYKYFAGFIMYAVIAVFTAALTYFAASFVTVTGVLTLIIKFIIVCIVPNFVYLILFFKTKSFKYVLGRALSLIKRS